MSRLVVVSNRVPLPGERGPRPGGLAVALAEVLRPGSLWFGWSGRRTAVPSPVAAVQRAGGISYATVDLAEADYRGFYVNFANGALWPLLHFRLGLINFQTEDYQAYRAVNRQFATALAPLLAPDDLVWVHDYHLFPLASELRAAGVANRLGFFLHTPFVTPALMEVLPRGTDLLRSMCDFDLIGFHTETYRSAFLECVKGMLGLSPDATGSFAWSGRKIRTIVDPIGIDANAFAQCAEGMVESQDARQLIESLQGRMLAIGVDRLDYSKGLVNRFQAIGHLLARYPSYRGQVSFLQVAARSREEQGDYQRLRRDLDRIVGDTNGRYSQADWMPLRYMTRAVSRTTLAGYYRIARLGLVTPLRDGMNLVAKEYVAAQDPANPGVLILSRFAGAAGELDAALIVNPFDIEEVAGAMHTGLSMDLAERQDRWMAMRERVWENSASHYCQVFIDALNACDPGQAGRGAAEGRAV